MLGHGFMVNRGGDSEAGAAQPKRVCMVAYTRYTTDARPRREAEALVARGDGVDFIALQEEGRPADETLAGVRVIRLPIAKYRGGSAGAYLRSYGAFVVRAFAEVTRRHLSQRYDVVHVHTMPDLLVLAGLGAKWAGAKVVLDVHDTMPELYQSKFDLSARHPLIRLLRLQEKLSCRLAHAVICVHEPHKALVAARSAPASKISVVLNVPDPRVFDAPADHARAGNASAGSAPRDSVPTDNLATAKVPTVNPSMDNAPTDNTPVGDAFASDASATALDPSAPPRLVYHGTIAARLGLDVALRAFAQVRQVHPRARFEIFGSGDDAPRIASLIDALGLQDAVHFPNKQFAVDEVPRLLQGASVGIVSNRDDPATRYMLPVKLLEYAYLGIPAVAPRLPAIEHYFDQNSIALYQPGDVAGLSCAILSLLDEPQRRERLRAGALRFASEYRWDHLKHALYAAIDR